MRRRALVLLLVFPALLAPTCGYLAWRLARGTGDALLLAVPFACVLAFPLLVRHRSRGGRSSRAQTALSWLAYFHMGLVSFLLVATVARDVLALATGLRASTGSVVLLAAALLLAGGLGGFLGPAVRRRRLRVPGLPSALRGLRIAQISDLHLSGHIGRRYVARVARKTLALGADLVAFTGDIGDGRVDELGPELEALAPIAARAFYVPGNHEVYWDLGAWLQAFRRLGMRVLLNEGERVSVRGADVFVGGVTDPACAVAGLAPDLAKAAAGGAGAALKVLLSHRPDPADEAAAAGFDLQLSGHTHGGQFFPWTLVAWWVHRYSLGLYRVGRMWVYVSAGTGSWGPRVRLGTAAEITLFELEAE